MFLLPSAACGMSFGGSSSLTRIKCQNCETGNVGWRFYMSTLRTQCTAEKLCVWADSPHVTASPHAPGREDEACGSWVGAQFLLGTHHF